MDIETLAVIQCWSVSCTLKNIEDPLEIMISIDGIIIFSGFLLTFVNDSFTTKSTKFIAAAWKFLHVATCSSSLFICGYAAYS